MKRDFLILITQSKQLVKYPNTQNLVLLCPCQGFFRCHHSWTSLPGGCERCDDVCARRDGKQGKDDYKGIGEGEGKKEGLDYNQVGQGEDYHHQCSYECHGWPNQKCKVRQTVFVQQEPESKSLIKISKITSLLRPREVYSGQHALPPSVQGGSGF